MFASRLETLFQKDARSSVFAAHTYDATWLAATALMWANTNEEPHSIKGLARGLRQISDPNGPELNLNTDDWNQLRASLEAGNTINISGTSGNSGTSGTSGTSRVRICIPLYINIYTP